MDALTRWLPAANGPELDKMARREGIARALLGLDLHAAGRVADILHLRDRIFDDRRLCCECRSLSGTPGAWRCASPQGLRGPMNRQVVHLLPQRCDGFKQNPAWPAAPERPQPEPY